MLSRRTLLGTGAAAVAAISAGCTPKAVAKRGIETVGIQTYTLRNLFASDPVAMFKMIKEAGYDFVELNGQNFEQVPPQKLKDMLDASGLYAPASHISLDMLRGDLGELTSLSRTLGLKYVVVPWVAEEARSPKDWKSHVSLLNSAGRQLRDSGVHLAYHNHQFEFDDLGGGTTAMDMILNDCDPDYVDIEIDMFWTALADVDIPAFLRAHPGRFKLCHIKDMGPNKADFIDADYETLTSNLMKNVGEGILPFEEFFALNDVSGMEYFIAEHDNPQKPYSASIAQSYGAIKNMRF